MNEEIDTTWINENHTETICDPNQWLEKANELQVAASLFVPNINDYWDSSSRNLSEVKPFINAYMMIMAFALENLIKGIIVCKRNEDVKAQLTSKSLFNTRKGILGSHDLNSLLSKIEWHFGDERVEIFAGKLSRYSTWDARYPASVSSNEFAGQDLFGLGTGYIAKGVFGSSDVVNAQNLFETFDETLKKCIEKRNLDDNNFTAPNPSGPVR